MMLEICQVGSALTGDADQDPAALRSTKVPQQRTQRRRPRSSPSLVVLIGALKTCLLVKLAALLFRPSHLNNYGCQPAYFRALMGVQALEDADGVGQLVKAKSLLRRARRSKLVPLQLRKRRQRGLTHTNSSNTEEERIYHDELTCRLSLYEFIDSQSHPNRKRHSYMCSPISEDGEVGDKEYEISVGDDAIQAEHRQTLQEGLETFVTISRCQIDEREGRVRLSRRSWIRLSSSYHRTRRRKLADRVGTLTALVVRIVMNDKQPIYGKDELYRIAFQDQVSIRNQYRACSFGKLRVEPSSLGVVNARVNRNTFQSTNKQAVNDASEAALGLVNSATGQSYTSLTEFADLILYVTPQMGDFLAYASVGGGQSVYNDKWGGFVASHMHETGHNLYLLHSWEGEEYLDYTGYMGGAIVGYHDRVGFPAMCYNAENLWNLGWMDDRAIEVDLRSPRLLRIAAFVDYDRTTAGREHVLAKAGNIYFHYNRAKGMNRDTFEYQDHLVLYQGTSLGSFLFAALQYPDKPRYDRTFPQGDFHAEICDRVDGDGSTTPDYLLVSIGFGSSLCSQGYQLVGSNSGSDSGGVGTEPTTAPSTPAVPTTTGGRRDKPPPNDDDYYYDDYAE